MERRKFLLGSAAAMGAAALGTPRAAHAQPETTSAPIADKGERGNAEFIRKAGIEVDRETVNVEGYDITLLKFSKRANNEYVFFVPHGNEQAAFDTALRAIAEGGAVYTFDTQTRNLKTAAGAPLKVDPNRIFSRQSKFWPIAELIVSELEGEASSQPYITLHNNAPIGSFALEVARAKSSAHHEVLCGNAACPRDVAWISLPIKEKTGRHYLKQAAERLKNRGFNAIIEYVDPKAPTDGSLSQYAACISGVGYINIETGVRPNDPDYLQTRQVQQELLSAVLEELSDRGPVAENSQTVSGSDSA